ncbi:rCG42224, partial [Rattus norvegicus]
MKCFCVLMHVFVKTCLLLKITDSCFHPQSVCSFCILEGWIEHKLSGFPFTKAVSPVWAVPALWEAQQLQVCDLTKCSEW